MKRDQADLCVIGSGPAGALVAAFCAQHGMRVLLLEAGSRHSLADRLRYLDRFLVNGRLPYGPHPTRDRFVNSSDFDYPLNDTRVKGVGGTSLHWHGIAQRLFEDDFQSATRFGLGADWPLRYADLEPWYGRAESELGVAGEPLGIGPPRSTPYPLPPFPDAAGDELWRRTAARIGMQVGRAACARNPVLYRGRSGCIAYGMCMLCPSGARYSADWHVDLAERTGRCELFVETVARRLELDADGRVRAVHATTMDGRDIEFRARRYVVAAHAIESARLLLLSRIGAREDQVGRHLMEHWEVAGGGLSAEPCWPGRTGFSILESFQWYGGSDRRERGAIKLAFLDGGDPLWALGAEPPIFGRALARHDCGTFGHWRGVRAGCEHQPHAESRITLDPAVRDGFGDPVPHLRFVRDATSERTIQRARVLARTVLEEAGLRDISLREDPYAESHHMGTCRMSVDPSAGVVDPDLRVHGTKNLHLVGSAVFPTAGCVPPTLTIAALALRLADHMVTTPPVS